MRRFCGFELQSLITDAESAINSGQRTVMFFKMNKTLKCDSSNHQIISTRNNGAKQKKNLIIIEIKDVILQPEWRFHGSIPSSKHAYQIPFHIYVDGTSALELLFLYKPEECVIVFRKQFFETLEYIYLNSAMDLIIYTRGNPEYAKQISRAIDQRFIQKYGNISDGMLYIYVSHFEILASNNAQIACFEWLYRQRTPKLQKLYRHWHII